MRARIVTVGLAMLALAACKETTTTKGNNAAANAETASGAAPGSAPPASSGPVQAPVEPSGTIPAVGAAPCRAGDLGVARVATDAGAGQRVAAYALNNNGSAPCALRGYPTVQLFGVDGKRLDAIQVVQSEANTLNTGGPPMEVTVPAGGRALFFLSFTGIQVTDKPCLAVARLQVTPPGNTQAIEVQDTLQVCTGQVRLTPARADTGAISTAQAAPPAKK
jgi:hypothetical protein